MKYIIVHNNYHILDIVNIETNFDNLVLIVIPHTINISLLTKLKYRYIVLDSPFSKKFKYLNIFNIFKIKNKIKSIPFNNSDELYIYAEEEWLNHYVANICNSIGMKIHLLEDGGLPNYIKLSLNGDSSASFQSKIKFKIIKTLWKFDNSHLFTIDGISYPQIDDSLFTSFICYFNISITRKIKKNVISKLNPELSDLRKEIGVFLNEDIYNFYTDFERYILELKKILNIFSLKFDKIYFKFHPRENKVIQNEILQHINNIPNILILNEKKPIEELFEEIKPGFLLSYHSAALLNGLFYGIQPVYLYYLCNSIKDHGVSKHITTILRSLSYNFLPSIEDFDLDFKCEIEINGKY